MTLPFVIPLAEYVSLGSATKAVMAEKRAVEGSKNRLARHREAVRADPATAPLSIFAELFSAEEKGRLTQEEVVSNAITVLANGTDPTANTLTYLVWAVCRRPEVKVQLLEEIDSLPDNFNDGHLEELSYLNQVIDETLRLYPAVAGGLLRTVPREGATIAGYPIPPGTIVSCQAYSIHRDPAVFTNPGVFRPDRWDSPTTAMKGTMMAWGGGANSESHDFLETYLVIFPQRISNSSLTFYAVTACLGTNLARMILRLSTAHFFRAFEHANLSNAQGMSDLDMEPEMMRFTEPKGQRCLFECR